MLSRGRDILALRIEDRRNKWQCSFSLWGAGIDLPLQLVCIGGQWSRKHVHVRKGSGMPGQDGRADGQSLHDETSDEVTNDYEMMAEKIREMLESQ